MVLKLPDSELLAKGINSYERAIIFSGLILQAQATADTTNKDNFKIQFNVDLTSNPPKSVLYFDFILPYENEPALKSMGAFMLNIPPVGLGSGLPLLFNNVLPMDYGEYPLPPSPPWADTYEEYFYWLCIKYQEQLLLLSNPNYGLININIDNADSVVKLQVNVPINYRQYLATNNFLAAASSIAVWPLLIGEVSPPPPPPSVFTFGNVGLLNNAILVGN